MNKKSKLIYMNRIFTINRKTQTKIFIKLRSLTRKYNLNIYRTKKKKPTA